MTCVWKPICETVLGDIFYLQDVEIEINFDLDCGITFEPW